MVFFRGTFRYPAIPWTEGLTLAEGILAAEYLGSRDPFEVYVTRQGQTYRIATRRLLSGADNPALQPDDIVEIRR